MQTAFVVWFRGAHSHNVVELNGMLANGWRFVSASPMSGSAGKTDMGPEESESRSLVILQRDDPPPPAPPFR